MISILDIFYYSLIIFPVYLLISNYFVDKKSIDKWMIGLLSAFTLNNIVFMSGNYMNATIFGIIWIIILDFLSLHIANRYSHGFVKRNLFVAYFLKITFSLLIIIFKGYLFGDTPKVPYLIIDGLHILSAAMNITVVFMAVKKPKIRNSYAFYIIIQMISSIMMQSSYTSFYKMLSIFTYSALSVFLIVLFLENRILKDATINKLSSRLDIVNVFLKILAVSNENAVVTDKNFNRIFHRISKNILNVITKDFGWQSGALYIFEKDPYEERKHFTCKAGVNVFIPLSISNDVSISMMRADAKKVELYKRAFSANESVFQQVFEVSQINDTEHYDNILVFTRKKDNSLMNKMGLNSYIKDLVAIPLKQNDELLGVILLQNSMDLDFEGFVEEQKKDYMSVREIIAIILGNLINTNTLFIEYEKTKNARQELDIARNIQQSMLPEHIPDFEKIEVAGFMRPATEIGGDYFDVIGFEDGNSAIMIGDIAGKGLPAGMTMLVIRTIIHTIIQKVNTPYSMVLYLSKVISEYLQSGKFISFIYMLWDNQQGKLRYASCGHEHILIYRDKTKKVERIKSGGIALGILDDLEGYIEEKEIVLEEDDVVLLYTDGITEARSITGEFYELDRLQETFGRLCTIEKGFNRLSSKTLKEYLLEDLDKFTKGSVSQYDDMTLVIIRKKG